MSTAPKSSSPRVVTALILAVAPLGVLLAAGLLALGLAGAGWLIGFALALFVCWFAAWRLFRGLLEAPPLPAEALRAERDRAALEVVEAHAQRVAERPPETLAQPRAMLEDALALAQDVARQYHPDATDPFARHTVPELAAAASLAFERLERRVDVLIPGSHLFTVEQWRRVARAPRWVARAGSALSSVKGLLGGARTPPGDSEPSGPESARRMGLREDALATMHAALLRELGGALIEMSAGRLRDGSIAYRSERGDEPEDPDSKGLPHVLRQLRHARASWVRASR